MTTQETVAVPDDRTPVTIFEYQRAESWRDAVELLTLWEGEAKVIAGGQSLVPMLNLRLTFPSALIDVNPIGALEPRVENDVLLIDANTRHRDLSASPAVRSHASALAHAMQFVGNVRVRNRGTFGGSLAHADPTAEIGAVILALGGDIVVLGTSGERTIPIDHFFHTYLTTAVEPDEVITGARIPVATDARWGFHEVVRRYSDFATVSIAMVARPEPNGSTNLRMVLGGVADRPVLVDEELLEPAIHAPGDPDRARETAEAIALSLNPDTDVHATADYRRHLVAVHTRRLLVQVLGEEGGPA